MPEVWKCKGCKRQFRYKWDGLKHVCTGPPPIVKTTITPTAFCKKFSHDYRARSWDVVREEVWEEGYLGSPEVAEHRAPVYKIKVVCKCCGDITYTEKTCYNQAEIPRKGVEVLVELIVKING